MAKAVTVLLLGKAIDDGKIKNENQLYSDFYENYANVEFGNKLTLEDLAKMEAGLNWKENYKNPFSPNAKAYYGKNRHAHYVCKNRIQTYVVEIKNLNRNYPKLCNNRNCNCS